MRTLALVLALAGALIAGLVASAAAMPGVGDELSITITFEKTGYGINAQTTAEVTVTGDGNDSVDVTVAGPAGGSISPSSFSLTVGSSRVINVTMPGTPMTATYTATIVGTSASDSEQIAVIRLDKTRVYYDYSIVSTYPYPSQTTHAIVRGFLWATAGNGQHVYTLEQHQNTGHWWQPGVDGPFDVFQTPHAPCLSPSEWPLIEAWPTTWPTVQKYWKNLLHKASNKQSDTDSDRKYWYDDSTAPAWNYSWGGQSPNTPGMVRYRVTMVLHASQAWQQDVASYDVDSDEMHRATRIAVRDVTQPNDQNGRPLLMWLTAFLGTSYEWGGRWFGGLHSNDAWAGGGDGYTGYGIDCSALVSAAAKFAGYEWEGDWRKTTVGLEGVSDYLGSDWKDTIEPGDIINKAHHHVVTYCYIWGTNPRHFRVIEAVGDPRNTTRYSDYDDDTLDKACGCDGTKHYYKGRRLQQ